MFRITQICFIAIMQTKPAFGDLNDVKEHVNLSWYVIVEAVWVLRKLRPSKTKT